MTDSDSRWTQRLDNFNSAYALLDEAVVLMAERSLSKLERQGVIQAFEFTYEFSWNMLRDYLRWQGYADLSGSRDTIREAFSAALIEDGDRWMDMLLDRNRTSHTYNEATANAILENIQKTYHQLFKKLHLKMNKLATAK